MFISSLFAWNILEQLFGDVKAHERIVACWSSAWRHAANTIDKPKLCMHQLQIISEWLIFATLLSFVHIVCQVYNKGPSGSPPVTVSITWPVKTSPGTDLLYLTAAGVRRTIIISTQCQDEKIGQHILPRQLVHFFLGGLLIFNAFSCVQLNGISRWKCGSVALSCKAIVYIMSMAWSILSY